MPARTLTRRRALALGAISIAGLTGCVSESPSSNASTSSPSDDPATSERDSPNSESSPSQSPSTGETRIDSVSVADFVLYPLAGVHPHVHRRDDTQ